MQNSFYTIELEKKNDFNMPARLKQVYSFLARNILDSVFVKREQEKISVGDGDESSSTTSLTTTKVVHDKETSMRILGTLS